MSAAEVWKHLNATLNFDGKRQASLDEDDIEACAKLVEQHALNDFVREMVWNRLLRELRQRVVPDFWATLTLPAGGGGDRAFVGAVEALAKAVAAHQGHLRLLLRLAGGDVATALDYRSHLSAALLSQVPTDFEGAVGAFYGRAFAAFRGQENRGQSFLFDGDESGEVAPQCPGCDQDRETSCLCQSILDECCSINQMLTDLGLLEKLSVGVVHTQLLAQIHARVGDCCVGNFASSQIDGLEKWVHATVFKWLELVYGAAYVRQEQVRRNLLQFLYHAYTQARIHQLFEIIIGYPESFPSVKDLHECLSRTQLKPALARNLRSTLEARLLHQGATTEDILIAYVSAIRAFGVLDPSGVLLDAACAPIKQYLRRRPDTVRHILHSLTDSGGELGGELELNGERGAAPTDADAAAAASSSSSAPSSSASGSTSADAGDWQQWTPAPSDADASQCLQWSGGKKQSEIVPMLVSIYGSKSMFVKEYRKLLSDRLLLNVHFDTEEEIRHLEFLKIRFGDGELHNCEVMLKDVADSKRVNAHIQSLVEQEQQERQPEEGRVDHRLAVSALIISAQYWDQLKDKPMKLPDRVQEQLSRYDAKYQTVKASRSLHWLPQCGSVDLELQLDDGRCVEFTVPPDLAAIICHFEERPQWSLDELSRRLELPVSHLRRRVHVWQTHGVLQEVGHDRYRLDPHGPAHGVSSKVLLETLARADQQQQEEEEEEDDDEDQQRQLQPGLKERKERDDGLQVYWSYVVGMLTNLEALSVERIHQMLKMFTLQGSSAVECSLQQLKLFLDSKVKHQLLVFEAGTYRLPKP